ncbi:MAG: CpaF family protein [Elusimicrobia bacterium]|nr:CpaF family protein [Elusimicrobiota bacterium]
MSQWTALTSQLRDRLQAALTAWPAGSHPGSPPLTGQPDRPYATRLLEEWLAHDPAAPSHPTDRRFIIQEILDDVFGLGPLEPWLRDPTISEIMVNGTQAVYLERAGKLFRADSSFEDERQLRRVIERIVTPVGRRVDEAHPLCDARLSSGARVNVVLPPLAIDGPAVTIRKFTEQRLSLEMLIQRQTLSEAMAAFLRGCLLLRKNLVVSGGTGSGKTTFLNVLSGQIPNDERIITIEDAAELKLQQPHVVRLESRSPNAEGQGTITLRQLVINALRMRPDRIIVGECRGAEALDMLQAMNTGHDGSLTTVHANAPREALARIETMALMAGLDLPLRALREQVRGAIHLIAHLARFADGTRRVVSVTQVTGMEGEILTTQELFRYRQTGVDSQGQVLGQFEATGVIPTFLEEFRTRGIPLNLPWFHR